MEKPASKTEQADFSPPQHRTRLQACKNFLYNPTDGAFCGRTCTSWAKILTFYLIFYAALAGFFYGCICAMLHTIDENEPKYQLENSIIGTSPGLASRPIPEAGREAVLHYSYSKQKWTGSTNMKLEEFVQDYQKSQKGHNCNYTDHKIPCKFDVASWKNCTPSHHTVHLPCIFFKLNKVYAWKPKYYKDGEKLPDKMPSKLQDLIHNTTGVEKKKVWLNCRGYHMDDKERLGDLEYYPEHGFPGYYYPFKKQDGFISPVVAVQFVNPKKGVEINVDCRSWAPNIVHNRKEQLAVLSFKVKFSD